MRKSLLKACCKPSTDKYDWKTSCRAGDVMKFFSTPKRGRAYCPSKICLYRVKSYCSIRKDGENKSLLLCMNVCYTMEKGLLAYFERISPL